MNYRERCYGNYISTHYGYLSPFSQEQYDLLAKVYAKRFGAYLPLKKDCPIIDVASGAGIFLYFLKKQGYTNLKGIDLSKESVEVARKMGINEVIEADLFEYLPQYPEKFEIIFASEIIEHLKKDEVFKLLDTFLAALKPGGKVILTTPNAGSLFGPALVHIDFTHEIGFTSSSLAQVLRVCGFEEVEIHGMGPIAHDRRSFMRVCLWKVIKGFLKSYHTVEMGTGRGIWKKGHVIFDPSLFAIARKPLQARIR